MAGWAECSALRPPGTRASAAFSGAGQPKAGGPFRPSGPIPTGGSATVTARFPGALGPGNTLRELAGPEMISTPTASRMAAAGLLIADG